MTFLQLRLAVEIAAKGSICAAAQDMKVSQHNASMAIRKLEKELGYPIFKRSGNSSIPTKQGYLFLKHSQALTGTT